MTITGKILAIKENPVAQEVVVVVRLTDGGGISWEKSYTYKTTEPITILQFKARLKADLINDLKPKTYTTELQAAVGKEFTLTV